MSLTRSKEVSLSCTFLSCPTSLPEFLPSQVTPYPDAFPDFYPRLCLIPYPSHYPEPYPSRYPSYARECYSELYPSPTWTCTRSGSPCLTRALIRPGKILPDCVPGLTRSLPGRVTFYPITYPALPNFLTRLGNLLLALPEALPTPTL
jgi:hypothetical protein